MNRLKVFFAEFQKHFERDSFKKEFNPYRSWFFLILIFFILLVALGLLNIYWFYSFKNAPLEEFVPQTRSFSRAELEEILEQYSAKELQLESFLKNPPRPPQVP